jgi:hypothetical protein
MKRIKYILLTLSLIGSFGLFALSPIVGAVDPYNCSQYPDPAAADYPLICKDQNKDITDTVKTTINVILYILGSLAVIMIIYSGILYVMSGGDANNVTKAKNTLMYSIIGLIVALLAYAIVNFVITTFK